MSQDQRTYIYSRRKRVMLTLYAGLGLIVICLTYGFLCYYYINFTDGKISSWVSNQILIILSGLIFALIWIFSILVLIRHLGRLLGYKKFKLVHPAEQKVLSDLKFFMLIPISIVVSAVSVKLLFDLLGFAGRTPEIFVAVMGVFSALLLAQPIAAIWARTGDPLPE